MPKLVMAPSAIVKLIVPMSSISPIHLTAVPAGGVLVALGAGVDVAFGADVTFGLGEGVAEGLALVGDALGFAVVAVASGVSQPAQRPIWPSSAVRSVVTNQRLKRASSGTAAA